MPPAAAILCETVASGSASNSGCAAIRRSATRIRPARPTSDRRRCQWVTASDDEPRDRPDDCHGRQDHRRRPPLQLQPEVHRVPPPAIQLIQQIAQVIAHLVDVALQAPGVGLGRMVLGDAVDAAAAHVNRSLVKRTFSLSSWRVCASGVRNRRLQLTPATIATTSNMNPLTARPAAQAGITVASARIAVTRNSVSGDDRADAGHAQPAGHLDLGTQVRLELVTRQSDMLLPEEGDLPARSP